MSTGRRFLVSTPCPVSHRLLQQPRHSPLATLLTPLSTLALLALLVVAPASLAQPDRVTLAGSFQSELGCAADWDPGCDKTDLVFDAGDGVWQATFALPAGAFEFKVALNGAWDENYGAGGAPGGANLVLTLAAGKDVKFYFDPVSHWVTSSESSLVATVPGSFQKALGCSGDWDPGCLRSWLQDPDGDGVYVFTTAALPPGAYEAKVALGESWDVNYGAGGVPGGPNIPFTVAEAGKELFFVWSSATRVLTIGSTPPEGPQPSWVVIPGSLQSELGCAGDWDPACDATALAFDEEDRVWQRSFDVPAGDWEYKAALNGTWDENYGLNATRGGANIPLKLAAATTVTFYYDNRTHWVTSSANSVIATVPGSFQKALGCGADWSPGCLRSWLEDPDGDGTYAFTTSALPAGTYEAKVAISESWDENYGAGGVRGGPNVSFTVPKDNAEITFSYDPLTHVLTIGTGQRGSLGKAQAHWVSRDTVAWNLPVAAGTVFLLHHDPAGSLRLAPEGVTGGAAVPLTADPAGLPASVTGKFPQLAGYAALKLSGEAAATAKDLLREQVAVSATDASGQLLDATMLQVPGVLDDLYPYDGPLGVTFADGIPTLRVWAPTARRVTLLLYADSTTTDASPVPMTLDAATGVWSAAGEASWKGLFYLYQVEVYVPSANGVEQNVVTDPYSTSLSRDSLRSQVVDLDDPALEPPGWKQLLKPELRSPRDSVIYELHVRDFSATDPGVPAPLRGTFAAFASPTSHGLWHLETLARAGLTHVHLLPAFDFATVREDRTTWKEPAADLAALPPDSDEQQKAVTAVADDDGFNWGYDPFHYFVPEGSYSTDPDGPRRTFEFRQMVQALNRAGLRVVMDVVYNHTTASGQDPKSVLDRIVPGYYHRLNADGNVETSTCCANTASEHAMMEKLMVDSLLVWAREYKVDGFRFDLMGHHMKANMLKVRDSLRGLTVPVDGVDGSKILLYGEGWDFGEVANGARGVNATQLNMAGTGIATFDDRLRDAARGGSPFSDVRAQGFLTGLFFDPSSFDQGTADEQRARLLLNQDQIRVGLSGGLASYSFQGASGATVTGHDVDYNGQPAGYAARPGETVTYVSAHDNETLFDAVQLKAARAAGLDERVRMHNLGLSLVAFSEGLPFFHAGDELLRSKSMDRDSYNSGDWFNRIDFTQETSSWGSGLPVAGKNQANFPIMAPLLADPALKPDTARIRQATRHLLEVLEIRRSSRFFTLEDAARVQEIVRFHNTGPDQVPGLIVMSLADAPGGSFARACRGPSAADTAVVLFNARPLSVTFADTAFAGVPLDLHPVLRSSYDRVVRDSRFSPSDGSFFVPAETAAVFVCGRKGAD